jgi:enoyl-CoA hydratase/carnithine racemase
VLVRRLSAGAGGSDELHLTLNRPQVRNAYSAAMRDELAAALELAAADATISRVLIDGAGKAFCSGGDLNEFGTSADPVSAHLVRTTRQPAALMSRLALNLTASVHGACVGAGVELSAFAGRVVADRRAMFRLPEVGMGLLPGAGGTVSLPRRIGRQRAAYLALSGETIDAATAASWGLVDEIGDIEEERRGGEDGRSATGQRTESSRR